jgi:SAM-dependent methyltransferase
MIGFSGWRGSKGDRGDKSSTVFVASSKEAIDSEWLLEALQIAQDKLRDDGVPASFELWNQAFEPNEMTAEAIVGIARTVGAAIVVLTADDETHSRGTSSLAPRDNLLFEAGLFLSHLGFGRVLLLREDKSKVPTDLLGVTLPSFSKPPGEERLDGVATQRLGQRICRFVSDVFDSPAADAESSVTRAIQKSVERAEARSTEIRSAISGPPRHEVPIPLQDAPMAYVDAVEEVQDTFIATTYLDSAFWTMRQVPVIEANESLAERIEKAGGTAKRLILLTQPIEAEIRSQRERRRSLRSMQPRMVERMDKEFNALAKANKDLVRSGFDVRVAFDHDDLWKLYLNGVMPFSAGDTELAVFDQDRIDIYSGFTSNGMPTAKVFGSSTHRGFRTIYDQTIEYVNELWHSDHAEDFGVFAGELSDLITESAYELDYESNWLLKYDEDADPGDARLKQEELKFVLEALANQSDALEGARHLDLGTCTGRYLAKLRERLAIELSIGVDLDADCIDHCKRVHAALLKDEHRFRIIDADIRKSESLPNEKFDLVTCMMGTLCHLRRISERSGSFEDPWQSGLENLAARLESDGDAFVAIWNTEDVPGSLPPLLSIYPQRSRELLLKHSPSQKEFESRLEQARLRSVSHGLIEKRLHVYHLQHA